MSFRRTLREWRAFRKINKHELAKMIGVSFHTYHGWENGNAGDIRLKYAIRLSEIFKCDMDEILFFEENPNIKLDVCVCNHKDIEEAIR